MASACPPQETTHSSIELHPKLLAPVSSSGDPLTSSTITSPTYTIAVDGAVQPHLGLKLEAHRRWNASLPVGFLWSVERVEINVTRTDADSELIFVLEIFLSLPTSRLPVSKPSSKEERASFPAFKVERRLSDFEELRRSVSSCVSMERQCSCQYCLEFIEYIRFSWTQPRRVVKLFGREEKRKQVLQSFINNFVAMGQRRVHKPRTSKRKCEAQQLVPQVLTAFLLKDAIY
uniref:PX domain-containing protein n=1 Tax=Phytophthora ramorum TaxID=164328 RepID=H3GQ16_PHYRM